AAEIDRHAPRIIDVRISGIQRFVPRWNVRLFLDSVRRCGVVRDRHVPHHMAAFGLEMLLRRNEPGLAPTLAQLPARMPEIRGTLHGVCIETTFGAVRTGALAAPTHM